VLVGFDEIDALAGEKPSDVEPRSASLDDAIGGDRRADPVPADRSLLVLWPWRVGFRRRLPRLRRGNPAGQSLVWSLGAIDLVEPVDLVLQLLERTRTRLLVGPAEQRLVEAFVLP
jgi:hypothetical protein